MDPEFKSFLTGKGISEARYEEGSETVMGLIHEFNESKRIAAPGGIVIFTFDFLLIL
jgi:hypothetical protein